MRIEKNIIEKHTVIMLLDAEFIDMATALPNGGASFFAVSRDLIRSFLRPENIIPTMTDEIM